ncbi:NAD(P)-binding domain-containing protein [Cupriavidus necator]|uniref:NAD(P)-binding domain-containing protein n=1 Tax=Cupriavidus necator TaxID=106590 RepID=UPI0009B6DD12
MRIGIIGAGHAGLALAAMLLRSGKHEIRIYSDGRHSEKLSAIMDGGGHMRFVDQPNNVDAAGQ